jgi:hypothetical protein
MCVGNVRVFTVADVMSSKERADAKAKAQAKFLAHQRKASAVARAASMSAHAMYGEYDWEERVKQWLRENPHVSNR